MPPLSNHDRQKRRRGIPGGRIGEHFPLQRLEISRSIVCFRIAQLDLDGSPAPVVLNDQIDLKALLISEIMDTVVDTAVGGKEHAHAGLRARVLTCRLSRKLVRKPKVCRPTAPAAPAGDVILRNYAVLNVVFTPFSL